MKSKFIVMTFIEGKKKSRMVEVKDLCSELMAIF
jgi:hypothetical protein